MIDITTRLRAHANDLRRRPTPLSDLIPLLQDAAKEIDRLNELAMTIWAGDQESPEYWRGHDEAVQGVANRWREALTHPYPKAGVMNEPLESLYRQTEALRAELAKLKGKK